jgi:aspartyl-tRNA(Asn)/glutamyl-tRNA(Gln) amidotransferase subunit A
MDITELSITELVEKIKCCEITVKEVIEKYLKTINKLDNKICAFMEVFETQSIRQAEEIDNRIKKGLPVGELVGVPIAVKDNICIKGHHLNCSSKILDGYISPYNATVINKLRQNDAILIGRTNMDEFAMGSSTENSAFKITKNPHDLTCVPGGSSGGSAAAVASNMVPTALGSDTGGSIRQPAAFCGVVGMKPTYGRVSRYGLVAFASSLDQIGPITKNVEDCALILKIISGYDELDSTSVNLSVPDYVNLIKTDIKGIKIGLPKEYFTTGLDTEVSASINNAIKLLENEGAVISDITLPHTKYAVAVYYIIAPAEASSNLARYDGIRYGYRISTNEIDNMSLIEIYNQTRGTGFGSEVKRRIMLGTYTLSAGYYDAYYLKAQKVRTLIKQDFQNAFSKVDAILTPTTPTPAFKISEKIDDPLQMYLSDIYTIPCNLAGLPGISIPCGFTRTKLPIGVQILGKPFDEVTVLKLAYNLERRINGI